MTNNKFLLAAKNKSKDNIRLDFSKYAGTYSVDLRKGYHILMTKKL